MTVINVDIYEIKLWKLADIWQEDYPTAKYIRIYVAIIHSYVLIAFQYLSEECAIIAATLLLSIPFPTPYNICYSLYIP